MRAILIFDANNDDRECEHLEIALFPSDASDIEITSAIGRNWEALPIVEYCTNQVRIFKPKEK